MIEEFKQKIEEQLNTYTSVLDKMSLKQARNTFTGVRTLIWIAPGVIWLLCLGQVLLPLGTLNFEIITLFCWLILVLSMVASCFTNWFLMLLTTRRQDKNQDERVDLMWDEMQIGLWQIAYVAGASIALPLCMTAIPFLQYLRLHPIMKNVTPQMVDQVTGNPYIIRILLSGIAVISALYLHSRFVHLTLLFEPRIREWMANYEFHYRPLHSMLSGESEQDPKKLEHLPVIVLGKSLETGDLVVQSPEARRRNSIVIGPIGAGKTSSWFRPQMDQDINHYLAYIRDYAEVSKDPNWEIPYGEQQNYLNGFAVVEPTDDLCKTIYNDCIAKGVPKDKIVWLDPENPDTPSLNLMSGPVDAVASNLTDIFTGLKESANDFFSQAERAYLEQHIYLLRLAGIIEGENGGFNELMNMFNDIYIVVKKVIELQAYVELLRINVSSAEKFYKSRPDSKTAFSKYKELKDHYDIAYETLQWFQTNVYAEQFKTGVKTQQSGPYKGWPVYVNRQEQFVQGLMNTLSDISKKIGLRRVLFRQNKNFNLDDFMKNGGILLCNTGKKELGAVLAKILGQIYTLSIESATFRRTPNVDPMFPLYMDEFPDYLSKSFTDFAAQARKFNQPINIACQSISQLSQVFGPDYKNTIMSVMLTRATFGDLGPDDAKALEPLFGEHEEATESINEQDIDLAADQAQNRRKIQTRVEKVPNITASEIMGLEKFTMAIRTPGEHKSDVFNRIRVGRITDESVKNDPNNFDMDNSADREAYEAMIANDKHLNPDNNEVDKQIIAQLKDKEYIIQWPSEENLKQAVNTVPTILDEEGNVIAGGDDDDDSMDRHSILPSDANGNKPPLTDNGEKKNKDKHSKVSKVKHVNKSQDKSKITKNSSLKIDDDLPDPFDDFGGDVSSKYTRMGESNISDNPDEDIDDSEIDNLLSDSPLDDDIDSDGESEDSHVENSDNSTVKENKIPKVKQSIVKKQSGLKSNSEVNRDKDSKKSDSELDEGREALNKSVFKSPNKGNNRNDNDLKVDQENPTDILRSSSISSQQSSIPRIVKKMSHPKNFKINQSHSDKASNNSTDTVKSEDKNGIENKNKEKKESMLEINDNNQIVEKKISNQHPLVPDREKMQKKLKHTALVEMQQGFNDIASDPSLTEVERLNAMKIFRRDERKRLTPLFPNSIDKVIDRISAAIDQQEEKVKNVHNTITGNDNLESMGRKIDETREAHSDKLNQELEAMMKKFDKSPEAAESSDELSTDDDNGFEEEHSLNDKDPWSNQPGMLNDNDFPDFDKDDDD